jgi:hypothetical protein
MHQACTRGNADGYGMRADNGAITGGCGN